MRLNARGKSSCVILDGILAQRLGVCSARQVAAARQCSARCAVCTNGRSAWFQLGLALQDVSEVAQIITQERMSSSSHGEAACGRRHASDPGGHFRGYPAHPASANLRAHRSQIVLCLVSINSARNCKRREGRTKSVCSSHRRTVREHTSNLQSDRAGRRS